VHILERNLRLLLSVFADFLTLPASQATLTRLMVLVCTVNCNPIKPLPLVGSIDSQILGFLSKDSRWVSRRNDTVEGGFHPDSEKIGGRSVLE
jgi:hypothetical protein